MSSIINGTMNGNHHRYDSDDEDEDEATDQYYSTEDDDYDSEEDDDAEMQAFISPVQSRKAKQAKWAQLRKKSKLKPLEILHSTTALRLPKALHPHDDVPESWCCRSSYFLMVIIMITGAWYWSGYEISSNSVVEVWHQYKLRDIKHWCLDPDSKTCHCSNPLEPMNRIGHKTWEMAHIGNVRDAIQASGVDVVFLGDSIIEGWKGTSFGKPIEKKRDNLKVFKSFFEEKEGGDFEGLALGIAGDKAPNLLWRIQNGEVPESLRPSVWWILIGTNDFLLYDHCSADVVLMGIKRVIDEMRRLRPGSTIVINSILPRTEVNLNGRLFDPEKPDEKTLWRGILDVNRELRKHCNRFRNVVFFDSTSIFLKKDKNSNSIDGMYIPKELMADYVHPTVEGYKRWGAAISLAIHQLMDASEADQGRKPLPHSWWDHVHSTSPNKEEDHFRRGLESATNLTKDLR